MTVWAYNTTIIQSGTIKALGTNDFLYVGKDAFLVNTSTGTTDVPTFLISGFTSFVTLNIDGFIGAGTTAIMSEPAGVQDLDITVGTTGKITGNTAIELGGGGGDYNIVNRGEISGTDYGIIATGYGTTSIINYGLIAGSSNLTGAGAILTSSTASGTVQINNYGQIGRSVDGEALNGGGSSVGWNIINHGQIFGTLYLGNSTDVIRNRGEIYVGDILNVYLQGGNDLFDARGGSVVGDTFGGFAMIQMGAGDDRYIAGDGEETVDGGNGTGDVLDYRYTSGITLALDGTLDATGPADGDSYINFENVWGSNTGADFVRGNAGVNLLIGNGGADKLEGMAGNDTIRGGRGSDVLDGGDGLDVADYSDKTLDISFTMSASANFDILVGGELEDTNSNFEGVSGGSGNDVMRGNNTANTFFGNQGSDLLDGGVDTVADTLVGGAGDDNYIVRSASDIVTETSAGGNDNVRASVSFVLTAGSEVESLDAINAAAATAINLTGNAFSQTITGNAGNNTIEGGGGIDTLIGLSGNDTYLVDSANDIVIEVNAGGTDTVKTAVSYTLGAAAQIEVLRTSNDAGGSNIELTGNDFGQAIVGNSGNNTIVGRLGNDTLTGGDGQDIFGFDTLPNATTNIDTITDFSVVDDLIALRGTVFTGIGPAISIIDPSRFKNLTTGGAVDADDRILYDDNTGFIYYDSDGSGAAAAVAFAVLTGSPTVINSDFAIA